MCSLQDLQSADCVLLLTALYGQTGREYLKDSQPSQSQCARHAALFRQKQAGNRQKVGKVCTPAHFVHAPQGTVLALATALACAQVEAMCLALLRRQAYCSSLHASLACLLADEPKPGPRPKFERYAHQDQAGPDEHEG